MSATAPAVALGDVTGEIARLIDEAGTIGCLAHKDADADSLGSALAFALSMREMGRRVQVMAPQPVPQALSYLSGFDTLQEPDEPLPTIFTFDCATMGRFGEKRELVERASRVVNIDHHASSERFGTINLVDPQASSTGEVVFALLRALDAPITPAVATNLYAALFTDTGGFRHENTTWAALQLGADLVKLGADPAYVALKTYKSRSVSRMRLEALAVTRMHAEADGQLIWSEITQDMLSEAGAEMDESEGVVDLLQSIDTMRVAVLLKQQTAGLTKMSVRTRDPLDATAVCIPFGGGGHLRAAGAEMNEPLERARDRVLAVARDLLQTT
ncbi:MAG: bifunctional oligoribonuclease/PAP phosphatase NrnA [Candidatus Dormibacteraeota bacterium]|nr:bifunctional oligoribonuclease/PAP phosphatase NrnA [Candidatus Dormibacteraeota bacterium]